MQIAIIYTIKIIYDTYVFGALRGEKSREVRGISPKSSLRRCRPGQNEYLRWTRLVVAPTTSAQRLLARIGKFCLNVRNRVAQLSYPTPADRAIGYERPAGRRARTEDDLDDGFAVDLDAVLKGSPFRPCC